MTINSKKKYFRPTIVCHVLVNEAPLLGTTIIENTNNASEDEKPIEAGGKEMTEEVFGLLPSHYHSHWED